MGCDFWMDERRKAPELLGKANERIWQLEAQVSKLEAQLAEAERNAKVGAWVGGQHCNSLCSICSHEAQKLQLKPGNLGPCLVCDNGRFFILREDV